jgi:glycosyltransferase involved in cell wall biosynthesis
VRGSLPGDILTSWLEIFSEMKLLVYSHFFAPSVGGVETIVFSLAEGLAALRTADGATQFDVTVATQTPAEGFDDGSLRFRVVRQPRLGLLWSLVRSSDVVHLAGPALAPLFLCWLARKPVVVEHHGYQASCPNGLLLHQPDRKVCPGHFQAGNYAECLRCQRAETSAVRSLSKLFWMIPRRFLVPRATANIAVTQHVLERQGLPRSVVILHGIDDTLREERRRAPSGETMEKVCFGYIGRFVQEKGVAVILEAARLLRQENPVFEIRLIGDGPERRQLEEKISRYDLKSQVFITGFLKGAAFSQAIRDVRVIVMPSIWEETAGLAAMEQMLGGRLVIASGIGGLAEIVGDTALLCTPGDPESLVECMRKVIQEPSLIEVYGQKARERALRLFSLQRMIDEHTEVYRQAIQKMKG